MLPAGLLALCLASLDASVAATPAHAEERAVVSADGGFLVDAPDAGSADAAAPLAELTPPALTEDSPAQYPAGLAGSGISGTVGLALLIDEEGEVAEVELRVPAHPALDEAALHAATALRFSPARLGGSPVAVRIGFEYRFVAPAAPPPDSPDGPRATLAGLVRTKGRRTPLPGAQLTVGEVRLESDGRGRFETQVAPGEVIVEVTAPGHRTGRFRERLEAEEWVEVVYGLEPFRINPYETVVRGERERTEVSRVSLNQEEIREVPGTMGDPFRVVMLLPGVSSVLSGVAYPVVRGASPASTGYFLDGIRVPLLFHLFLGPAVIHPDFIDGLDFFPGAPPTQYGRLLGGVIEGRTSRPRDEVHATLYADLINAGAFVEVPIEQTGTSVSLAGRVSYTAWLTALLVNEFMGDPAPGTTNSSIVLRFWDYQGRVEQALLGGKLRLLAFGSSDTVGTESDDPRNSTATQSVGFHRLDLRWRGPAAGGDLEAGLTWGLDQVGIESWEGSGGSGGQRTQTRFWVDEETWAARARHTLQLEPRVRSTLGLDLEQRRAQTTLTLGSGPDEYVDFAAPREVGTFLGAWAQLVAELDDRRWTLVPGLRLENYHAVGANHLVLEPRLTVRRALAEGLVVKGAAGLYHQQPTTLIDVPLIDIASLRWGLQEGAQVDLGVEWKIWNGLELTADVYVNPLLRTLEIAPFGDEPGGAAPGPDGPPTPGGGAEDPAFQPGDFVSHGWAYGFELMLRHPLGGNWFGWISYSLQRSTRYVRFNRYDAAGQVVGQGAGYLPYAFDQTHVLNVVVSYSFPYGITAGVVFHLNSGRPEAGGLTSWTQVPDETGGYPRWVPVSRDRVDRLPVFWRLDVRLAKTWAKDAFTVQLYLDVLNVAVQSEVVSFEYGYDGFGTLSKRSTGIPLILPILGLKAAY